MEPTGLTYQARGAPIRSRIIDSDCHGDQPARAITKLHHLRSLNHLAQASLRYLGKPKLRNLLGSLPGSKTRPTQPLALEPSEILDTRKSVSPPQTPLSPSTETPIELSQVRPYAHSVDHPPAIIYTTHIQRTLVVAGRYVHALRRTFWSTPPSLLYAFPRVRVCMSERIRPSGTWNAFGMGSLLPMNEDDRKAARRIRRHVDYGADVLSRPTQHLPPTTLRRLSNIWVEGPGDNLILQPIAEEHEEGRPLNVPRGLPKEAMWALERKSVPAALPFVIRRPLRQPNMSGGYEALPQVPASVEKSPPRPPQNLSTKYKNNVRDIKKNWESIRTALEIAYGRVRSCPYGPANRHTLKCYTRVIEQMIHRGLQTVAKDFSNMFRRRAMLLEGGKTSLPRPVGGTSSDYFVASGLSRALILSRPAKKDIQQAVDEAIERICTKQPMPNPEVLRDLSLFILRLLARSDREVKPKRYLRNLPTPSTKSVVEQPSSKGGGLIAYEKYPGLDEADTVLQDVSCDAEMKVKQLAVDSGLISIPPLWRDRSKNYLRDRVMVPIEGRPDIPHLGLDPDWVKYQMLEQLLSDEPIAEAFVWDADNEDGFGLNSSIRPTRTLADKFEAAVADCDNQRRCQVLPIVQKDGKIRVATVHTAAQAWVARAMSAVLMPVTKRLSITRDSLHNRLVNLHRKNDVEPNSLFLYSADFQKSTDPLSIALVRFVLTEIARHIDAPAWFTRAIPKVIAQHEIEGVNRTTECGALMGQGPAWTALCVLNAFCAEYKSTVSRHSYAICGDDLIGLWSKKEISRYAENTALFHLVLNKNKSYVASRRGVFCERHVIRTGPYSARCRPSIRIGEASGARAIDGLKGLAIHDSMRVISTAQRFSANHDDTHKRIRALAARILSRTAINIHVPGSLGEGGGGGTKADAITVLSYARYGPIPLYKSESDPRLRLLRRSLRVAKADSNGISCEDVISRARAVYEIEHREKTFSRSEVPDLEPRAELAKLVKSHRRGIKALVKSAKGPINAWKRISSVPLDKPQPYVRTSPRLIRTVSHCLRRKQFQRALNALRQSWRQKLCAVDAELAFVAAVPNQLANFDTNLVPTRLAWGSNPTK